MHQNSITIKSETIEEAIQTALNILGCSREDIDVQIISPPSKSLFGLRKRSAEISIIRRHRTDDLEEKNVMEGTSIPVFSAVSLEDLIEEASMSVFQDKGWKPDISSYVEDPPALISNDEVTFGSWVYNNEVFVKETSKRIPIVEADSNLKVFINGERLLKPQLVTSTDLIEVILENEVVPCSFWVEIKDNNMMATLSISPGKSIKRVLVDTEPQEHLVIRAKEIVSYFIDIQLEDVLKRLQSLQIQNGINYSAIREMINNGEGESIIAKGLAPIEGLDGDIEILIDAWNDNDVNKEVLDENVQINYREGQSIQSVEPGQVIAKLIPAVPGRPGKDLFERVVPPKPVQDVTLKLGKSIQQINNHIVASDAGRPFIHTRGKLVNIDVIKELVHKGDVSLEVGNIHFPGDVRITGNILDSMTVEATGKIYINGTVNRAVVHSTDSMKIDRNVFSSKLSAGGVNHIISTVSQTLSELLTYSNHILAAVNQIQLIRSQQGSNETIKISYLIRLLLEKKYGDFTELINKFCMNVDDNEDELEEDWIILANSLKKTFITISLNQNIQLQELKELVEKIQDMYETYILPSEPRADMEIPYAINSILYSSGDIHIFGQGVYQCNLRADNNIHVRGVCRGGEISAGNFIFLDEVGSENGGKTTLSVPSNGKIYINYAHVDTTINIGRRVYTFNQGTANITAYLDTEGNLQLF